MSATDPAIPTPPAVNYREGAAVIDISARRTGGRVHTAASAVRGRWTAMTGPTPPAPAPEPGQPPGEREAALVLIADDVQGWFLAVERTLADEETAAVFRRTLDVVDHTLNGATAQNIISKEQRTLLAGLLDALRQAPDLV